MERDKILETLSKMSVDELDSLRDKKQVDLHKVMKDFHLAKDDLLTKRKEKADKLIAEGNSTNKVDSLLRYDSEVYLLKKKVMALSYAKQELELEIKIVESFYWKART